MLVTFHMYIYINRSDIFCADNCTAHARHNLIIRGKLTKQKILCMQLNGCDRFVVKDNKEQHEQSSLLVNKFIKRALSGEAKQNTCSMVR